jgi:hypothetical protein
MTFLQTQKTALISITALLYLVGKTCAFAQERNVSEGFERCKTITNDQARLSCLKTLLPEPLLAPSASPAYDPWPLIRTPHPKGGPDAVAIMRTADTAQSDPDLAGLMIRCQEKQGFEVLLVLVRPFPPRAKREVAVVSGTTQSLLQAEASFTGTALILPIEATAFTSGPWQGMKELTVSIKDPDSEIHGVIQLSGIAPALAKLSASCARG